MATPPGLEEGVLANEHDLLSAHQQSLADNGSIVNITSKIRTKNGESTRWENHSIRLSAETNYTEFRVQPDVSGFQPAVWGNKSTILARQEIDGEIKYHQPPRNWTWASAQTLTGARFIHDIFHLDNFTVDGTENCDNTTCMVLRASDSPHEDHKNFTATAYVDSSGIIRSVHAEYDRVVNGGLQHEIYIIELAKTSDVSVNSPEWAKNRLGKIERVAPHQPQGVGVLAG